MNCPVCGRPGGVLLLETVAPCDPCVALASVAPEAPRSLGTAVLVGRRRQWVRFGTLYPFRHPPPDCIGWDGYGSSDYSQKADREFAELPDPDSTLRAEDWGLSIKGIELVSRVWKEGDAVEGWFLQGEP